MDATTTTRPATTLRPVESIKEGDWVIHQPKGGDSHCWRVVQIDLVPLGQLGFVLRRPGAAGSVRTTFVAVNRKAQVEVVTA